MALVSNLYPPIVPDTTIVFSDECQIPFELSAYNSIEDIKGIQISLVNLRTNASGFNNDIVQKSSGIKIINKSNDKMALSVNINNSDMADGQFSLNQFYKVQIRFSSVTYDPAKDKSISNWLYENRNLFSEWSKTVLIKCIKTPVINLRVFDEGIGFSNEIMLTQPTLNVVGKIDFDGGDLLKSYNIKLYQKNSNTLLYKTQEIYPQPYGSNQFNYELVYDFQDAVNYTFKLTYTSLDGYVGSINKSFYIVQTGGIIDQIPADINIYQDSENGRIKVQIVSNNDDNFIGNLIIRRTSSQSQFHKWEDVHIITYAKLNKINITWYDRTIKSGVWYKYGIQKENAKEFRGAFTQTKQAVMCLFDDIFLTRKDCQLKINFNPSLNEFKYNVIESQQNPIGSKFPFIKRNSANFFRTFPIGGLISSFMDTTDWYDPHFHIQIDKNGKEKGSFHNNENQLKLFTSKDKVYKNSKTLYDNYNKNNNINEYQDYIYEREFRQKVYDFLYSNDVKLFRSTTQGNILVKLMNIDFQPMESLGRRLYSFTATAVQIDEPTILNFDKYGIQTIGKTIKYIGFNYDILGQLYGTFGQDQNVLSIIESKQKKARQKTGYVDEIQNLKWLRIEITSPPYVIIKDSSLGLIKAPASLSNNYNLENMTAGYIVKINDKPIIIPPTLERRNENSSLTESPNIQHTGYFELKGDNIEVSSLSFPETVEVKIDYIANFAQYEDDRTQVRTTYYDYRAGQLYNLFYPTDSIFRQISNKYLLDYSDYYQRLINISGVALSGPPKTTVYIKDSRDMTFNRHVLENGYLQLIDDDISINGIYFCGIHLEQCTDPLQTQIENEISQFHIVPKGDKDWTKFSDISAPENGGIYQFTGIKQEQVAAQSRDFQIQLENHTILVIESTQVEEDSASNLKYSEYKIIDPESLWTLLLDRYKYPYSIYFAYYYGCWYLLPQIDPSLDSDSIQTIILQSLEPFKHIIRYLRQDEYVLTGETFDDFSQVLNPIQNGVYTINHATTENNERSTIDGTKEYLINTDSEYSEILKTILKNSENKCIYYKGKWCHFTANNDVLYPVEAIVDYYCEIEKGVY